MSTTWRPIWQRFTIRRACLDLTDQSRTEWLTILDISKELIERVRVCLETVEAIREGREPPKCAKALLADRDSAEQSALAQLNAIVKAHSTK